MKRYAFFIVLIMVAVSIGSYFYTTDKLFTQADKPVGGTSEKTFQPFSLKDINGNTINIDPSKTREVFVINFWTTWCPPCREEMPELEKFYKAYGSKVKFFGIDEQESADKVNNFVHNNNYTYPILLDASGEIGHQFKVQGIPTTVIIDANGTIVYRKTGGVTLTELKTVLSKAGVQ